MLRIARLLLWLMLVVLAAPAYAQATWSAPLTLSAARQDAIYPQVAVDRDGDAIFVWQRRDGTTDCGGSGCFRIQARVRSAAGSLTPVQTLSAPGQHAYAPDAAVDQNGDAVFSWTRQDKTTDCRHNYGNPPSCGRIQTRTRSAGGTLSAVHTLSAPGYDAGSIWGPDTVAAPVAVDQSGNAVFVWLLDDDKTTFSCCFRVQARVRSATGALSATQTLSGYDAYFPRVDVDPSGNAVFAWTLGAGCASGCARFETRARSAAGVLSATQTLAQTVLSYSNRTCDAACIPADLAVDQNGNAIFAWERFDGTSQYCCYRAQTRARSPAGTLSATQTLSLAGKQEWLPRVAVDPAGDAVFAWEGYDDTTGCGGLGCPRVQARTRSAAGALGAIEYISNPERLTGQPADVAVDQDGNSVFVWDALDSTSDCGGTHCLRVKARSRSAAGVLSAIQLLAQPGQHAYNPRVAINPGGNAAAAWQRFDGTNDRVQGATGP